MALICPRWHELRISLSYETNGDVNTSVIGHELQLYAENIQLQSFLDDVVLAKYWLTWFIH